MSTVTHHQAFLEAARDWLTERRAVGRTISSNTAEAYQRDLNLWAGLLDAEIEGTWTVQDLDSTAVKASLARMNDLGHASSSRRRALTTLKGFTRWLVEEGRLTTDPASNIQPPKAGSRLPVAFQDEELGRILTAAEEPGPKERQAWPELDLVLVSLLGAAGLRVSEVCSIRVLDYQAGDEPSLRVRGKGSKLRLVPLDPAVAQTVDDYLDSRKDRELGTDPDGPLLVRPTGQVLTRYTVNYRITRLYTRAGVRKPDGEASHALRHTFAVSMVNNGVPIHDVKELLGHESLETTSIYLRSTGAHLRTAAGASSTAHLLSGSRRR